MLRKTLMDRGVGADPGFRLRGREVSRLEGFSDAVFAFSITLLVVSLEVPRTYADLMHTMRGFLAFGICFALLMDIWFEHYHYFRRYGLEDGLTRGLTAVLLFVVLFYVYPLKFVFNMLAEGLLGGQPSPLTRAEGRTLMQIYGAGAASVFTIYLIL